MYAYARSNREMYNNNNWKSLSIEMGLFSYFVHYVSTQTRSIECRKFGKEMHADKQAQIVCNVTQIIQMKPMARNLGHLKRFSGSFIAFEESI